LLPLSTLFAPSRMTSFTWFNHFKVPASSTKRRLDKFAQFCPLSEYSRQALCQIHTKSDGPIRTEFRNNTNCPGPRIDGYTCRPIGRCGNGGVFTLEHLRCEGDAERSLL